MSLSWLLRLVASVTTIALLLYFVPISIVLNSVRQTPPGVFGVVLMMFVIAHCFAAMKWWLISGRPFGAALAIRAHFAGLGANLCLPGVAGGDAVRLATVMQACNDRPALIAGSLLDRLVDLLALLILAFSCVLVIGADSTNLVLYAVLVLVGLAPIALFVVAPKILRWIQAMIGERTALIALETAVTAYQHRKRLVVALLFCSTAIQAVFVSLAGWLATYTGVSVSPGPWIFAWSSAKLISILPISLGGLGVREASMAALLQPFGADAHTVIAASLLWQCVLWSAGVIGGLVVLYALVRGPSARQG